MLLYDMQPDVGDAHGRYINERFVRNSLDRQGVRDLCIAALALHTQYASNAKYEIIEILNQCAGIGCAAGCTLGRNKIGIGLVD